MYISRPPFQRITPYVCFLAYWCMAESTAMFVRGQQIFLSLSMSPNPWLSFQSSKPPFLRLITSLKGILLPLCRRGGNPPNMQVFLLFGLNQIITGLLRVYRPLCPEFRKSLPWLIQEGDLLITFSSLTPTWVLSSPQLTTIHIVKF